MKRSFSDSHRVGVVAVQPFQPLDQRQARLMRRSAWAAAASAATRGADLVVLPEYFNTFGLNVDQTHRAAARTAALRRSGSSFCRRHACWLLLPLVERRGGRYFNTALLFDRGGRVRMQYDKTHLTIAERDQYAMTAGDEFCVCECELGRIGVMICYDIYFPEVARELSLRGAQIILFPSLQRSDTPEGIMLLNRARALDAGCFLVRSSYGQRAGQSDRSDRTHGGSCVVAPDGRVIADAGRFEGVAEAIIDPTWQWCRPRCGGWKEQPVRQFLLEDRRAELYRDLVANRHSARS